LLLLQLPLYQLVLQFLFLLQADEGGDMRWVLVLMLVQGHSSRGVGREVMPRLVWVVRVHAFANVQIRGMRESKLATLSYTHREGVVV